MSQTEYEILLDLVKKRRTVRQFKPDPLPDGCIEEIIEVARWAPSGFHTQPWEFLVVRKRQVKDAIIKVLDRHAPPITRESESEQPSSLRRSFRDAPAFIFLLADWRAKIGLPGHPTEKNPTVTSVYCSSLASTFLYMHLAAAALGLASQWYTAASRPEAENEIRKIIGIPEALSIYDMMVLGYPAGPPNTKELRNLREMIHFDDCGPQDFRTDEQVIAYAKKTWDWCMSAH